jgi:hypothetical protein
VSRCAMFCTDAPVTVRAAALCLLLLLCWTNPASAQPPNDCLKVKKISTSYDALRQGTEFDVRITFTASGCALSIPVAHAPQQSRILLKGAPGLQVQDGGVAFTSIERLSEGPPVVYGAHQSTLHLRLSAAQDMTPGMQHPSLPLCYETIEGGVRVTRNTEVEIPVNVVAHDAPVKSLPGTPKWNPGNVLLIPFRLIELIFTWDGC